MALNTRHKFLPPLSSSFRHSTPSAQPKLPAAMDRRVKVPVVYYLSRNGQLEHPHFLEVPLSSDSGQLYLRDVIQRLNQIRGSNMASSYSWSSKRSYKNGYVWQDLSEDDCIHPCHGHEYILKGSELLLFHASSSFSRHHDTALGASSDDQFKGPKPTLPRQTQSWSSSGEYMVFKPPGGSGPTRSIAGGSDMATQTGEDRKMRRLVKEAVAGNVTELGREGVSPPSSSSSTETLGKGAIGSCEERGVGMSGRLRVSETLMQLIACGSKSVKDGALSGNEGHMGARDQGRRLSSVDA